MDGMGPFQGGSLWAPSETATCSPPASARVMSATTGKRGKAKQTAKCRVPGCTADLSVLKKYNIRYRICTLHHNSDVVRTGAGLEQRFCQKCAQFHDLPAFDGKRHSCRERLNLHNQRRRKTAGFDGASGNTALLPSPVSSPSPLHRNDSLSALERILCSDEDIMVPSGCDPSLVTIPSASPDGIAHSESRGTLSTQRSISSTATTSSWINQNRQQQVELRVPNLKDPSAPPLRVLFRADSISTRSSAPEPVSAEAETMNKGHTVTSGSPFNSPRRASAGSSSPFCQQVGGLHISNAPVAGLSRASTVPALLPGVGPSNNPGGEFLGARPFTLGAPGSGRILPNLPRSMAGATELSNSDFRCWGGEQQQLAAGTVGSPPHRTASL